MREYNQELLHRVQKLELDILKDFIHVCEENDLTWWAFWGTGIGALRHGGFIPWDDDIDVCLPREDYNRLLDVFSKDYADRYQVVNCETFEKYPLATTRLMVRDSCFVEEPLKGVDCPLGIFLDIYAFDHVARNEHDAKKQMWKSWIYSKLLILRQIPFPVVPANGLLKHIIHAGTALFHAFMVLFRVSPQSIYRKMHAATTKYNNQPSDALAYFCDTAPDKSIFKYDDLFPLRKISFEDLEVNFPQHLEKLLTISYGDFMQLPPEEKRKNHFPYLLKFPGEDTVYRADDEV